MNRRVTVYTDGSCSPNPGKGGWAYIVLLPDCEIWGNGGERYTTNNVMEMSSVINFLKDFEHLTCLRIISDSKYVINCAQNLWKRNKNTELWREYDKYAKGRDIVFEWVRGHTGDEYNELVDKYAKSGRVEVKR
jgi:ribonuclease HI